MGLSLAAALSISGTMAYLTATDSDVNVMTTGNIKIAQNEYEYDYDKGEFVEFQQDKLALPAVFDNGEKTAPVAAMEEDGKTAKKVELNGKEMTYWSNTKNANIIDKYITVKNNGNMDIYFRTILAVEIGNINMNSANAGADRTRYFRTMSNYDDSENLNNPEWDYVRKYLLENDVLDTSVGTWKNDDPNNENKKIATVEINGQNYMFLVFTHKTALEKGTKSAPSLRQLCLGHGINAKQIESLGPTWNVIALSQAVQASGFDSADVALDLGFGEVTATNVANWFKNIAPTDAAGTADAADTTDTANTTDATAATE